MRGVRTLLYLRRASSPSQRTSCAPLSHGIANHSPRTRTDSFNFFVAIGPEKHSLCLFKAHCKCFSSVLWLKLLSTPQPESSRVFNVRCTTSTLRTKKSGLFLGKSFTPACPLFNLSLSRKIYFSVPFAGYFVVPQVTRNLTRRTTVEQFVVFWLSV